MSIIEAFNRRVTSLTLNYDVLNVKTLHPPVSIEIHLMVISINNFRNFVAFVPNGQMMKSPIDVPEKTAAAAALMD